MTPPTSLLALSTLLLSLSGLTFAWLPWDDKNITSSSGTNLFATSKGKIRGVNLGSLFVMEPWIAEQEWSKMGCGQQNSEFDCVSHLGQEHADKVFQKHWDSWITKDDISNIVSLGLNTIRVPIGYWLYEDLVDRSTEHFPKGGYEYFERICEWARDAGVYVIVDLHGAPGSQVSQNPDTGQVRMLDSFFFFFGFLPSIPASDSFTNILRSTRRPRASTIPTSTTGPRNSSRGSRRSCTATTASAASACSKSSMSPCRTRHMSSPCWPTTIPLPSRYVQHSTSRLSRTHIEPRLTGMLHRQSAETNRTRGWPRRTNSTSK